MTSKTALRGVLAVAATVAAFAKGPEIVAKAVPAVAP
jgi:hypothetical protein